jgi:glycosyltransferase involved in cell wall biosynthesis
MENQTWPLVTVIAPCRNEAEYIRSALGSILSSDYPRDRMEVLVVDGRSTDGTRNLVSSVAASDPRIRLLDNPRRIVPCAMNIGIRQARGEYIVRVDCHTRYAHEYIRKCVEISRRTGADNVGGYATDLPAAETNTAKAIAAAASCRFGVGNSTFRLSGPEQKVDTVPFGTFRKEVFQKVGFYDERLVRNQDIELNHRIRKAGGTIIISPEIHLEYFNRATYRGLWQQAFNNGLWNPYTLWLVGGGLSWRHFVPMAFVLCLFAFGMGSLLWEFLAIGLGGILFLYLAAAGFFALRQAQSRGVSGFHVLWSFIVLHIAYGLGSLWAILTIPIKFPHRKPRGQLGQE